MIQLVRASAETILSGGVGQYARDANPRLTATRDGGFAAAWSIEDANDSFQIARFDAMADREGAIFTPTLNGTGQYFQTEQAVGPLIVTLADDSIAAVWSLQTLGNYFYYQTGLRGAILAGPDLAATPLALPYYSGLRAVGITEGGYEQVNILSTGYEAYRLEEFRLDGTAKYAAITQTGEDAGLSPLAISPQADFSYLALHLTASAEQPGSYGAATLNLRELDYRGLPAGDSRAMIEIEGQVVAAPIAGGGFVVVSSPGEFENDRAVELIFIEDGGDTIRTIDTGVTSETYPYSKQFDVAQLEDGSIALAWTTYITDREDDGRQLLLQRFALDGAPLGAAVRVNTGEPRILSDVQLTALDGGGLTVAWTDTIRTYSPGGSYSERSEIHARVFAMANGVTGSAAGETLAGTAANDVIDALGGADTIAGGAGDDRIDGGEGQDVLDGGEGIDTADYESATRGVAIDLALGQADNGVFVETLAGFENAVGSGFADRLTGTAGANRLEGLAGDDVLAGGEGDDTLLSGAGDDLVVGGAGLDRLEGGSGVDIVSFAGESAGVIVDLAIERATTAAGTEIARGFEGAIGTAFDDQLRGGAQADTLDGGAGGADLLDGRTGDDTARFASMGAGVIIDLGAGAAYDGVALDTLVSIENATGSAFDDLIFGSETAANIIDGGAGADMMRGGGGLAFPGQPLRDTLSFASAVRGVIVDADVGRAWDGLSLDQFSEFERYLGSAFADSFFGSAGSDDFEGGAGDDLLQGGAGDDILVGGAGNDMFIGGEGIDNLTGGDGDDVFSLQSEKIGTVDGRDRIEGGAGFDTVSFERSATRVDISVDLNGVVFSSIERVVGSVFADRIGTHTSPVIIEGGAGADTLTGNNGGATLSYAYASQGVIVDLIAGRAWDGESQDIISQFSNVTGSAFDDNIYGTRGRFTFSGGTGGADRLDAGVPNPFNPYAFPSTVSYAEALIGNIIDLSAGRAWDGAEMDTLAGFGSVEGSAFDDSIFGDGADNRLYGRAGDDLLNGSGGRDRLEGGAGADTMEGGDGADVFVFERGETEGDHVLHFESYGANGGDRLEFEGFGFDATLTEVAGQPGVWRVTTASGYFETLRIDGAIDPSQVEFYG